MLTSTCFGLSTVTKIVDPDNGGGTHYTSLDAWEDNLGGTTTGHLPNDDQIAQAQCRSSGGTDDTTAVVITGWTTDATRYIEITGEVGIGDFPSDGIFDGTKYNLALTDATILAVDEDYVRIRKIQFLATQTGANVAIAISIAGQNAGNLTIIDSCIIKGACSGTGAAQGVRVNDTDTIVTIYNTIVDGFFISSDTAFRGLDFRNSTTVNVYNCTVNNCTRGISRATSGTVNAINYLVFECEDDFSGTITMTYCASDDDHTGDSATNFVITQSADDYAALVTDADGGDYSVTDASSELYQTGNGATPKGTFTDDIIDTTRDAVDLNWDIGAYELIAAAAPSGQVIMISGLSIILAGSLLCLNRGKKAA